MKKLPTPMFLDLDRRSASHSEGTERYFTTPRVRRPRNIFGRSLSQSLFQAASLAEDNYSQFLAKQRELSDELRREIVLDAFWVELPGQFNALHTR